MTPRSDLASWALLSATALVVVVPPLGCDSSGVDAPDDVLPDAALVDATLVDQGAILVDTLRRFEDAAASLEAAAAALAAAPDDAAALADAQDAWFAALDVWQEVELMQVGPVGSSLSVVGGEDRRDRIYGWPTVDACAVDRETVARGYEEPAFFDSALPYVTGLGAMEALLFDADTDNACPNQVDINRDGTWDALGPDGVRAARAAHAEALAAQVQAEATALVARYAPEADNFVGFLSGAIEGGPYAGDAAAQDAVFRALFYLYQVTAEEKVGPALGLYTCTASSCVELVETRMAGGSHRWLAANLRGARALVLAGETTGYDALLEARGHGDLAAELVAAFDAADMAVAALSMPVDVAATEAPEALQAAHDTIRAVGALLKEDVATVLGLQIPEEAAGDND